LKIETIDHRWNAELIHQKRLLHLRQWMIEGGPDRPQKKDSQSVVAVLYFFGLSRLSVNSGGIAAHSIANQGSI